MHYFNKYIVNINIAIIFVLQLTAKQMNTTAIRNKVAAYMEVGFTIREAFEGIRNAQKKEGKKITTADKIAESKQNAGNYDYGFTGKEYGARKWGAQ